MVFPSSSDLSHAIQSAHCFSNGNQLCGLAIGSEGPFANHKVLRAPPADRTGVCPTRGSERKWMEKSKRDEHFQHQRQRADNVSQKEARRYYMMMQEIGDEMQTATGAFTRTNHSTDPVRILDLCMAPGGYTASALKQNPTAEAVGITLPPAAGGHEVFLNSTRSIVIYTDITMFAKEFGVDEIPSTHPGRLSFSLERPFLNQRFDLVICDGQVLRTHKRAEYREKTEATRLTNAQLIFALQRIRPGGTLIMLLHKIEFLSTIELLYQFSQFSNIKLFKPVKKHAIRSTFYLIAKNVQPDGKSAFKAVVSWKKSWWDATFGGEEGLGVAKDEMDDVYAQEIVDCFGGMFAGLARPVWKTQVDALERSNFV